MKPQMIARTKLYNYMKERGDEMFLVHFTKIDGEHREMFAHAGVQPNPNTETHVFDYITVFDIVKEDFRTVNIATVDCIRYGRTTYWIKD